ncbi:MAG: type II toxin-antitoxin system PemK/MazF family toxin [Mobilitalea sp.]
MRTKVVRGDIFYANLQRGLGSEQQGYRPVVIIQNNIGNRHSSTTIIVPITGQVEKKAYVPTHCVLEKIDGLEVPSMVLLEQIMTVDKSRLRRYVGRVEKEDMIRIESALKISIGLCQ